MKRNALFRPCTFVELLLTLYRQHILVNMLLTKSMTNYVCKVKVIILHDNNHRMLYMCVTYIHVYPADMTTVIFFSVITVYIFLLFAF